MASKNTCVRSGSAIKQPKVHHQRPGPWGEMLAVFVGSKGPKPTPKTGSFLPKPVSAQKT